VTTPTTTTGAAPGQEAGGQHEESGLWIGVAGLAGREGGSVRGQDLGALRVIAREAGRVRLGQLPRRALIHDPNSKPVA
jgi:hypothetical protein